MTGADGERFSTGAFTRGLLVAVGSGQSRRILVSLCSAVGEEENELPALTEEQRGQVKKSEVDQRKVKQT